MYNVNSFKKARIIEMSPQFKLAVEILSGRLVVNNIKDLKNELEKITIKGE